MADELRWTLVVPLKGGSQGKSRLAEGLEPAMRAALARAMAGDTLAAAAAARLVDRIIVVTGDPATGRAARRAATAADEFAGERAGSRVVLELVGEPEPGGLNPAVRAGVGRARLVTPANGIAVLLGDLPALHAADLDDALAQAAGYPLGVVPDAAGTGTTLLTAAPGVPLDPAFGPGSAQVHRARGHVPLDVARDSGLTCDVDDPADLLAARARGVGTYTTQALQELSKAKPSTGQ